MIETLKKLFEKRKQTFNTKQAENNLLDKQINDNKSKISKLASELTIGQEALQFIEDVANSRRGKMRDQIEGVISEALQAIYGTDYKVELIYDVKNNRSHLDIILIKQTEEGEVRRDMSGFGGGVADTISVPLRLLVLLACRQTDKVCLLDECYKHVNPERIELVAEFIKSICDKLGVQVILCSHHEVFENTADVTYCIRDNNGKSEVIKA